MAQNNKSEMREWLDAMDALRSEADDSSVHMRLLFVAYKLSLIEPKDGGIDLVSHIMVEQVNEDIMRTLGVFADMK